MGTRVDKASACLDFVKRAESFGVRGVEVDGMDVEAVANAARKLFSWSREGNGPGFLIASAYRFYGHGRKDPSPYRDKAEEAKWKERDPLVIQKNRLLKQGLLDGPGTRR